MNKVLFLLLVFQLGCSSFTKEKECQKFNPRVLYYHGSCVELKSKLSQDAINECNNLKKEIDQIVEEPTTCE